MQKDSNTILCPRCGCADLWKFGFDPDLKLQRYRCKNPACRMQFVPARPRRPQRPKVVCPKCGANMSLFKRLSDALRFRCNHYRHRDHRRCTHKINIPLPGKDALDMVVDPKRIRLIRGKVKPIFCWNRMKFSKATVALALYFHFFRAMPAPAVVATLRDLYRINVSHDTITRWGHKAAFLLADKCTTRIKIPIKPGRKPRVYADETELNGGKNKRWFWMSYCRKYDLMLGRNLTARRDTRAARDLLAMTHKLAPQLKNAELLTDGLWSYPSAMGDLGIPPQKHLRYISFFERPNNNALERKWSNFKNRARVFRGIRSDLGKMAYIEGQIFY